MDRYMKEKIDRPWNTDLLCKSLHSDVQIIVNPVSLFMPHRCFVAFLVMARAGVLFDDKISSSILCKTRIHTLISVSFGSHQPHTSHSCTSKPGLLSKCNQNMTQGRVMLVVLVVFLCALALFGLIRRTAKCRLTVRWNSVQRANAAVSFRVWAIVAGALETIRAVSLCSAGNYREFLVTLAWFTPWLSAAAVATRAPHLLPGYLAAVGLAALATQGVCYSTGVDLAAWPTYSAAALSVLGAALEALSRRAEARIRAAISADCRRHEAAWDRRARLDSEPAAILRLRHAADRLEAGTDKTVNRARQWDSRTGLAVTSLDRIYAQVPTHCNRACRRFATD